MSAPFKLSGYFFNNPRKNFDYTMNRVFSVLETQLIPEDKEEFVAQLISGNFTGDTTTESAFDFSLSTLNEVQTGTYKIRFINQDDRYNLFPNPFLMQISDQERKNLISLHKDAFFEQTSEIRSPPSQGSIVILKKQDGIFKITKVLSKGDVNSPPSVDLGTSAYFNGLNIVGFMKDFLSPPIVNDSFEENPVKKMKNRKIEDMAYQFKKYDKIITSNDLLIAKGIQNELNLWKGKIETYSSMKKVLTKYWDNLNVKDWTPSGVPWSAAFISYVLKSEKFPGAAAHTTYADNCLKGSNGWYAFSLKKTKIKIAIGDVLIKPRYGDQTSYISSHGDVVYKIEGNKAYLAGGNLGDSAKGYMTVTIDKDRNLINSKKYIVALKKNPRFEE